MARKQSAMSTRWIWVLIKASWEIFAVIFFEAFLYSLPAAFLSAFYKGHWQQKTMQLDSQNATHAIEILGKMGKPNFTVQIINFPYSGNLQGELLNLLYNKNADDTSGVSKGQLPRSILDAWPQSMRT